MVTSELPQSAKRPPLLLLLISLFMVYIVVAIAIQSACIYLADLQNQAHETKPSHSIQRLVTKIASFRMVNVKKPSDLYTSIGKSVQEEDRISKMYLSRFAPLAFGLESEGDDSKCDVDFVDWIFIAMVLDKIGFLLFIFLEITTVFALLLFIPAANNWGM